MRRQGAARGGSVASAGPCLRMDEPFSAVDTLNRDTLKDKLRELQKKLKKTVVCASHDRDEALKLTTHVGYQVGLVGRHRDGDGYVEPNPSKCDGGALLSMPRGGAPLASFEPRRVASALSH